MSVPTATGQPEISPTPSPDFRVLFEAAPGLYLVLTPDLKIVAVSDGYLRATMTQRQAILGRGIFEVFPDNPEDPTATGVSNLSASLGRVLRNKTTDAMAVQKYDIRRPDVEGGGFEERYWSPVNSPVFGPGGEVAFVIHRVEDVTEFVRLKQRGIEQEKLAQEMRVRGEQMEAATFLRAQELQEANRQLRQANEELSRLKETLERRVEERTAELTRTNEALREVEARFTAILNYSPSCIFAKDRQGRYLLANKALGEFTGRDAADLLGRTDADVFPAEVAARFARDDGDLLASGSPRIYEESFAHADTTVTALTVKFPLVDADGTAYAVCGIATDISDRKRAQDALRESERQWRSLAEALPNLVWTDLPDGQCDYLSSQWASYTGVPENELLGLTWLERVIHPDDRERTLACWTAAVEDKGVYDLEYRIRRHDGQYHWFKTRGVPIRDGQGRIVKWFGTCTDIEDQKQVMEELRQSEERFARFMQHLPGLAWVKDSQGRYVYANDAAVKAFRHSRNDLYGKTDAEIFPANTAAQFQENDGRALASGTGVQVVETLEQDDGIVHHSIVSKFPIPGREGRPALVGGVAIDITDLKRAEEELRDADRRKDEFLATLAHELRNPLAPIRNSLQILKMPRVDAETAQRSRDMMERQVHHLVRLVDDLLDVSRVMRGKIELRRERVELATVVARAVETVQPLIDAQGHGLTVNLPPESLPLDADPVRLAQVVGNLLTNAAKYTEANGRIRLTAQREGREAVLRVRDTGIGIAPDMLPKVFGLFVQVDHAATRSQGGLGIGLTLVKNLVEMHKGTVEASSAGLGKGSEFVVRLPLSAQEGWRRTEEESGETAHAPARSSGRLLLVVDDNTDAADSLAMLLRLQGHEVRVAHDGPAALEMAKGYRPEMVFLDIGMPGMDGYEVARRLRRQPGLEKVRLAALTGWGQEEDRRRTAEAGFDHHLVKPVEPGTLEALLESLAGCR